MATLRPISTSSIHDIIQMRVKEYIVANNLQPGDPLPSEMQLTEQLGVSRTVVREALRALEALGFISSRRGEGRVVSGFNLDPIVQNLSYSLLSDLNDVRDILELREHLEAGFISKAISAMDEDTLNLLHQIVEKMCEKGAAGEIYLEEDLAFHRTIFLTTGNRLLVELLDVFWHVYQSLREKALTYPKELMNSDIQNHVAILRAIEMRDVEQARRLVIDHFGGVRRRLNEAETNLSRQSSDGEA